MYSFDWHAIGPALPLLWNGMLFSLQLLTITVVCSLTLGTMIALMRISGVQPLVAIGAAYTYIFRSIPLVLAIFWFYFLVPLILLWLTGARDTAIGAYGSVVIAFVIFEAAYFAEVIRAGILSVPTGQTAAGVALGLTWAQTMRDIVLPQAFRNMLPVIVTKVIIIFQDTSLVYVVSLNDFLGAAGKIGQRDGRLVEFYLFAGLVYFIMCFAASQAVRRLTGGRAG